MRDIADLFSDLVIREFALLERLTLQKLLDWVHLLLNTLHWRLMQPPQVTRCLSRDCSLHTDGAA